MIQLIDGQIRFTDAPFDVRLAVAWRVDNAWKPLSLRAEGDALVAADGPVRFRLVVKPDKDSFGYAASFMSSYWTRIRIALLLPAAPPDLFHLIPGFLHGDNNLAVTGPGHMPNLTASHPDDASCSTYWEARADRATHPVSAMLWSGGIAAISIQPYSDGSPRASHTTDESFIRNGLSAQLATHDQRAGCAATIGYGNLPKTFHGSKLFSVTSAHFSHGAKASGQIFLRRATDRRGVHDVIRSLYFAHRERVTPAISREEAVRDVTRAFLTVNWHGENGANADGTSSGVATPFFGGKPFRINFTNMRCNDEQKSHLQAWRTLAEIGWSGGAVIGYPMLASGLLMGDDLVRQRGIDKLNFVADGISPATGLLFDVSGAEADEGKRLNWWWSAPPVMDCHCAYTNASATYYLLKSHRHATRKGIEQASADKWMRAAMTALDTICKLQLPDGNFGYTYRGDRPEILDPHGFAGAWFLPGLAYAYEQTHERRYLDAASRAIEFYHAFVRDLTCWGTPMDTLKSIDAEGIIGFIRGAVALSEATGSKDFLTHAIDGAHYEYLFRYGIRTRPQYKPLRDSPWSSFGASMCATVAGMVHPMGAYLGDDLHRLAHLTDDTYHADRAEDGLDWATNSVAMYPEHTGYGVRGVMTERWVPSDGATMETHPDGTPSSMWFSYNGWAAAAVLEALTESLMSTSREV